MDIKLQSTDSQDSDELVPPGTSEIGYGRKTNQTRSSTPDVASPLLKPTKEKVTKLRAFSIQKKSSVSSVSLPKITGSGNTTVLIGKLSSVKTTPKPGLSADDELRKQVKPPKPGTNRKSYQDSYCDMQKRTLAEIEDMKRKMELVDLGIPLGLICPSSISNKAMPTKAMPPIKSFLARSFRVFTVGGATIKRGVQVKRRKRVSDPSKVDEIIREAKKAKAEGKEFKFDYQKLLPDYDNPFQRKKEEHPVSDKDKVDKPDLYRQISHREKDRRKSDNYEYESSKRRSDKRLDDRYRHKDKDRSKDKREKDKDRKEKIKEVKRVDLRTPKETDVNLNDYLVCDSWSLDEKNSNSSPHVDEKTVKRPTKTERRKLNSVGDSMDQLIESMSKKPTNKKTSQSESPLPTKKVTKLQPVIDSFKFEIDPNDEEILDIFDENSGLEKYSKPKSDFTQEKFEYDERSRDISNDSMNDDFLESVINEIKRENIDEGSPDKALVEYELSPCKDDDKESRESVTPELSERMILQSSRSDYSDYRSTESDYKTSESGYKSVDSFRSTESYKDYDCHMSNATVASLDVWSFVLKICQPLLFRHDKNKCFKETLGTPKVWYSVNPKACSCVKDRAVVYTELEMCKTDLVYQLYGYYQDPEETPKQRGWYPRVALCESASGMATRDACEWEGEDSQQEKKRSLTPQTNDEISLDREYQRFMDAVLSEASETKVDTSRSTTPVHQEARKKKIEDEPVKKAKKIKLSSEGWSQESDIEDEHDKTNSKKLQLQKVEKVKPTRKRKRSSSTLSTFSESEVEVKKKKASKKTKLKVGKNRKLDKKKSKKLKEKRKKHKKQSKIELSDESDDSESKKRKKTKKKKQQKLKKKRNQKKKTKVSSSSSDSSDSSESDSSDGRKKKRKKRKESTEPELFDVNILNNIKTEKLTDDEKNLKEQEFSPRRQQTRKTEIINVKELQDDFVGNNIHIKKEIEEEVKEKCESEIEKCESEIEKCESEIEKCESEIEKCESEIEIDNKVEVDTVIAEIDDNVNKEEPIEEPMDTNQLTPQPAEPTLDEQTQVSTIETIEKENVQICPIPDYSFSESQIELYEKDAEAHVEKFESYETGNYEMYEQLAMAYQNDVANKVTSPEEGSGATQRIETVVRVRARGEIKCDWRAGDQRRAPRPTHHRPSRWGLKPGEVNIVLTGEGSALPGPAAESEPEPDPKPDTVYRIESIANRHDTGYDEAYMDMYGASDRLQYGDCFGEARGGAGGGGEARGDAAARVDPPRNSLDARIDEALKHSVLSEVAKEPERVAEREASDKGILATLSGRSGKRVSFADGYAPGQDSDVEEPPIIKKVGKRRGCAWPCPLSHPDHVPLWDALPPPLPPPGDPPPHLIPRTIAPIKTSIPLTMVPPEPPPGLISFA